MQDRYNETPAKPASGGNPLSEWEQDQWQRKARWRDGL
jgi:hypothetical protein